MSIGARLARKLFEMRGNHSEMHLSEKDLAASLDGAIEWSDETRRKFDLQELQVECDRVARATTYTGGAL